MAAIHQASYGEPPLGVETHMLDHSVLCVLEIELLPHEEIIAGNGLGESVRLVRSGFQEVIRPTFIAAVEAVTGREVVAFVSETHLDPSFVLEYFRLGEARA
jgi:uncharacterized protein YbcI